MRTGSLTAAALVGLALASTAMARADESITRQQADTIIDELRQIRRLLERLPAAPAAAPAPADELKLDRPRFQKCLVDEKYKVQIEKDMSDAEAAGVNGTPTFVIGRAKGDEVDGVRVVGALPYATFDSRLKEMLAAQ